jgi:hypothetical protein
MLTCRLTGTVLFMIGLLLVAVDPASANPANCGSTGAGRGSGDWYACAVSPSIPDGLPTLQGNPGSRATTTPGTSVSTTSGALSPKSSFCTYSNTDTVDGTAPPAPRSGAGRWMLTYCGDSGQPGGWSWIVGGAAGAVVFASPAQLARQAYARLTPPVAVPDYNPRSRAGQPDGTVVGFVTWLWLDGQSLSAKSVTASAGPNSATVTARPSSVSFDPGDGSPPVVCTGGGTAYDPAQPNAVSDCVHRYIRASGQTPGGAFVLTAQVIWTASWTGTKGTGGVLPALTVAASTPVRVDELQAVNE